MDNSNKELEFKQDVESVCFSDDFWYALTNGYIDLDILEDNEAKTELIKAIQLVQEFEDTLYEQDFYEEM